MRYRLATYFFMQPLEQDIENGDHKDTQYGTYQQSPYGPRSNRIISFGANAARQYERKKPDNKGERCHENGPQAHSGPFKRCLHYRVASTPPLNTELND